MCTVTFIPTTKGIYLTSNRDESEDRGLAVPPAQYTRNGATMIYPQDKDAGGSWITLKQNGDAAVLLNGAFINHQLQSGYRKSRGLVFLEIVEDKDPYEQFTRIDLKDIAPFTIVLFSNGQLSEGRWDGYTKHFLLLDATKPHIWSSATLYDEITARERKRRFLEWFSSTSAINTSKVTGFHLYAGKDGHNNGIRLNRGNKIFTVSITCVFIKSGKSNMTYRDLQTGMETTKVFLRTLLPAKNNMLQRTYWSLKKTGIRITNWEYWPAVIIYGPLYPYWCWLSLKARSFFFFSAANPGIENAGFVQERKSEIYKLIPQQYYPRTKLCYHGGPREILTPALKEVGMHFPLIAKPDMGEKGLQVQLLQSEQELIIYNKRSKVNFLLQEFITYEREVGIFYYRIPGEESGHISGMVGKEFLTVTGDGISSIENLIQREDRSLLQLSALKQRYGDFLNTILADQEPYVLVPYGNHSRGAKFVDLSHLITTSLTRTVDKVCKQIPGFNYGRLDIKFNTWEELIEGKNFFIIELNGAGSEPTHIYDPAHSLIFAWKEICRHWRLLYKISQLNAQQKKLPFMTTAEGLKMLKEHTRYLKLMTQV